MSNKKSIDTAREECIKKMGASLGTQYHALWQEVAWLHGKWSEFVELFGRKPSRIDLLNKVAPHFFYIVQNLLWEETLLHITRLTDSPKSVGKKNLTICSLPNFIAHQQTKKIVTNLVDIAKTEAEFCRDWRNRRIAHLDFDLATNQSSVPLKPASREKVGNVLVSLANVLNAVSHHYCDSTTAFQAYSSFGGSINLLYTLHAGLKARQERIDRISQSNEIEAWEPPDL